MRSSNKRSLVVWVLLGMFGMLLVHSSWHYNSKAKHCFAGHIKEPSHWNDIRLPDWIHAQHYELDMITDLNNFKFQGQVKIELSLTKESNFVVVHSRGLEVVFEAIESIDRFQGARASDLDHQKYNSQNQYNVFYFKEPLNVLLGAN